MKSAKRRHQGHQLQQQIAGTLPAGHVYNFGCPSDILIEAGLPDLPIEMAARRLVNKAMQENHPFELYEITDLVLALNNPLLTSFYFFVFPQK